MTSGSMLILSHASRACRRCSGRSSAVLLIMIRRTGGCSLIGARILSKTRTRRRITSDSCKGGCDVGSAEWPAECAASASLTVVFNAVEVGIVLTVMCRCSSYGRFGGTADGHDECGDCANLAD